MGFWSYWGRVLTLALRHTWDKAQSILFGLMVLTGILGLAAWQSFVQTWQAAVIALGSLVVFRLMLAPYWLHQQVSRDLQRLRRAHELAITKPASKLRVEPSLGVTVSWTTGPDGEMGDVMLIFDLAVQNISDEPLRDCQIWTRWAPVRTPDLWSEWRPSSALFNLRPQETLLKPLFQTPSDRLDAYIVQTLFHEDGEAWVQSMNMPQLGGEHRVEAEVRSMSTVPARTRVIAVPGHGPRKDQVAD